MTRASRFYPVMFSGEVNSSTVDESDNLRKCHVTHWSLLCTPDLRRLLINQKPNVYQDIILHVLCCYAQTKLNTYHLLRRFINFSIFIALKSDASNILFQRSKRIETAWRNREMGECFPMQYIVPISISAEGTTYWLVVDQYFLKW